MDAIKEIIKEILCSHGKKQVNLSSESAVEKITEEIMEAIKRQEIVNVFKS